jgi:hypothetical protein
MGTALKDLRRLRETLGGRNKLAKLLSVTGPYIGRVLKREKPMTEELAAKLMEVSRENSVGLERWTGDTDGQT